MAVLTCFMVGVLFLAQVDNQPPGSPEALTIGEEVADEVPEADLVAEATELTTKIEKGVLTSDGRPVQFWRDQFEIALADTGGGIFDGGVLLAFLAVVQKEGLPEPFRFTEKRELQEAADILGSVGDAELQKLRRELLAAELNLASGRGLVASPEQIRRMIRWAESLIAAAETETPGEKGEPAEEPDAELESKLRRARGLMFVLNTGGGGGEDE